MALELFKTMTGARLVHVPSCGDAPAVADALSGHVPGAFVTMTGALMAGQVEKWARSSGRRGIKPE